MTNHQQKSVDFLAALASLALAGWAVSFLSGRLGHPIPYWDGLIGVWLVHYIFGGRRS
jgi:hypothetical protein